MKPIQLFDTDFQHLHLRVVRSGHARSADHRPGGRQIERDLETLREYGLKLVWAVETHAHADHITSAGKLAELAGAKTAAPVGCNIGTAGVQLKDGDTLQFGGETLKALHTPGHTAGSMSFVWRDHVFTGDTLLINGCGRTDFQSGSAKRSLPQPHAGAVQTARRHHRLAGPRLPGPHPFQHRPGKSLERARGGQNRGRIRAPSWTASICPSPSGSTKPFPPI